MLTGVIFTIVKSLTLGISTFIRQYYELYCIGYVFFSSPLAAAGIANSNPALIPITSYLFSEPTPDTTTLLDIHEASHLTFMREEEKLARDVYLTFAAMYPQQKTFSKIATEAEQTHTDVMRDKLLQYNLTDPNPETNNLPDSLGIFSGSEWGWYFDEKFKLLTDWGSQSELEALYAGAFIEELDMHDIAVCPQVMIDNGYPQVCGLGYTDEQALIDAYQSLISGSESHLRAYVGKIEAITGKSYTAQYLSQSEVDAILAR